MSKKLKIGIVGCGGIATNKHIPSLLLIDEVEIVAYCDILIERAEKSKKQYGTSDTNTYTDYKEMITKESLDLVHVCTPNSSHSSISIYALNSGLHVMCEKPMAKTSTEALAMLEAAKQSGKKLTIGYQNRFRPDSIYLKRTCERGDLGDIYFSKAHALRRRAVPTWGVFLDEEAQGGGPLIDIGTHALDLTLWMMDNYDVASVKGSVYKKLSNQTETGNVFGDWDPAEFTVEDSAFAFITMKNGATIILESSWALNTLDSGEALTTLCGTKAGADMKDSLRINGAEFGKLYTKKPALTAEGVDFYDGDLETPALTEAKSWIHAIINDEDPVVSPKQAYVVTKILEAVYESAKTGQLITFE